MESNEIINIIEENRYKLLGEILVDENEYPMLKGWVKSQLYQIRKKAIDFEKRVDLKFALGVTQIAIHSYDGNFWDNFCKELGGDIKDNDRYPLCRLFMNTIRKYKLFEINSNNDREQYVENIKAHAIAANSFLPNWFDFWEAYYESILFRQFDVFGDEDIVAISEFMKKSLNSQSDVVYESEAKGSRPPKSYRLPKATRRVLAECDSEAVKELIRITLRMIDEARFKGKMPDEHFGRFEKEFIVWFGSKQEMDLERYSVERNSRVPRSGRPYLQVDLNMEEIAIVIPKQRFLKNKIHKFAYYEINSGEEQEKGELTLTESMGWYTSKKKEKNIYELFADIEIKISTKESVYFHESDYRIFDSDFRSIKRLAKDADNFILLKKGASFEAVNKGQKYYRDDNSDKWDIVSLYVTEDTELIINGKPLNVFGHFSDKPYFDSIIDKYTAKDSNGNALKICKRHPVIYRMIDKQKFPGLILRVNNEKYEIGKAAFEKDERSSEPNKFAVSVDLNRILDNKTEIYDISWDIPGEGIKHICKYVLIAGFKISSDKNRYHCGETAVISINSDVGLSCDSATKTSDCEYRIERVISENNTTSHINLQLFETIDLIYELPVVRWGFSEDEIYHIGGYEWFRNISNPLYVLYPALSSIRELKIKLVVKKNVVFMCSAERTESKDIFKADISTMIEMIQDLTVETAYSASLFVSDGYEDRPLFKAVRWTYTIPASRKWLLSSDEQDNVCLLIDEIRGDDDLYINVRTSNDKIPILEGYLLRQGKNVLKGLYPNITYDIFRYTIEDDLFGSRTDYPPLYKLRVTDTTDLSNASFDITGFYANDKKLLLKKDVFTIEIKERLSENIFDCELYKNGRRLIWDLKLSIEQKEIGFTAEIVLPDKALYYLVSDCSLYLSTAPKVEREIERNRDNVVLLNHVDLRADLRIK